MSTKERLDILKERLDDLFTENQRLKQLCDRYEEEHNNEFKKWQEATGRINKAIEYIGTFDFDYLDSTYEHNARIVLENILEILKGSDKE